MASSILFSLTGYNTCTDIVARESAVLAAGSIMRIKFDNYKATAGEAFQLISVGQDGLYSADNVIFNFSQATLSAGLAWDTTSFSQNGTIYVRAIPEPASMMLGLIGFVGFACRRRKK